MIISVVSGRFRALSLAAAWLLLLPAAILQAQVPDSLDLSALTIEELMDIEVFSVARKEEKIFAAAAAVFAITPEEIQRSGATSLPETLRLVPGMEVARLDASKWAVSSRGFNDIFANKLLVLIDGRSVYTPLFSGVIWDTQEIPLEDIERIEVIRGPGATLWGANAVNGIINVLTRPARDTQGGLLSATAGSEERGLLTLRYGGRLREDLHYRIYGRYATRDALVFSTGAPAADDWQMRRGGFRLDWERPVRDVLTLEGDLYRGTIAQTFQTVLIDPPYQRTFDFDAPVSGDHLLGRWVRTLSATADLALQAYYDRTTRDEAVIRGHLETWDLDFQHRFALSERQEILWGAGYRLTQDDTQGSPTLSFAPPARTSDLFSAFAQEEFRLAGDRFRLTAGAKLEHSDFSDFEVQPNLRLRWQPAATHTLWAAISRAIRAPARVDHDSRTVAQVIELDQTNLDRPLTLIEVQGNPRFQPEELVAWELGYRARPADALFLDLAGFLHLYDRLRTLESRLPYLVPDADPPYLLAPVVIDNRMRGRTWGLELATEYQPLRHGRLRAAYTFFEMDLDPKANSVYTGAPGWEGSSPRQQFSLRASLDLRRGLELDLWGRYLDPLPALDLGRCLDLDARLGWSIGQHLELSVVGQNLLSARRAEFQAPHNPTLSTEDQRGAYGALRWHF